MVQVVEPVVADVDQRALRVFLKAIELVGGPRKLIEYRRLTWLPSLMEGAYAVILKEEAHKTTDEIAQFLGISSNAVRLILGASTENVQRRLEGEEPEGEARAHVAGGLAKLAYQALKQEEGAGS